VPERVSLNTCFGDRLRDAADYRRDDQNAQQVVDSHEDALELSDRVIHLANG